MCTYFIFYMNIFYIRTSKRNMKNDGKSEEWPNWKKRRDVEESKMSTFWLPLNQNSDRPRRCICNTKLMSIGPSAPKTIILVTYSTFQFITVRHYWKEENSVYENYIEIVEAVVPIPYDMQSKQVLATGKRVGRGGECRKLLPTLFKQTRFSGQIQNKNLGFRGISGT